MNCFIQKSHPGNLLHQTTNLKAGFSHVSSIVKHITKLTYAVTLVVEAVSEFVPDDDTNPAVVDRLRIKAAVERRLEDSGREDWKAKKEQSAEEKKYEEKIDQHHRSQRDYTSQCIFFKRFRQNHTKKSNRVRLAGNAGYYRNGKRQRRIKPRLPARGLD